MPSTSGEFVGWAFTAFTLLKVASLPFAGRISDRLKPQGALFLALFLNMAGLILLAALPERAFLGRMLEGFALALATIAALALLRDQGQDANHFGRQISKFNGLGSLGFVLGTTLGFIETASLMLQWLAIVGVLFFAIHPFIRRSQSISPPAVTTEFKKNPSRNPALIGLACTRILGLGWSPVLAFWSLRLFSPSLSSLSFIVLGAAFAVGALLIVKPRMQWLLFAGIPGYLAIEASFTGFLGIEFWWLGIAGLGMWFGASQTFFFSRLGWHQEILAGRFNSAWMALADVPSALIPALLWYHLQPEDWILRVAIAGIAVFGVIFTFPRASSAAH